MPVVAAKAVLVSKDSTNNVAANLRRLLFFMLFKTSRPLNIADVIKSPILSHLSIICHLYQFCNILSIFCSRHIAFRTGYKYRKDGTRVLRLFKIKTSLVSKLRSNQLIPIQN